MAVSLSHFAPVQVDRPAEVVFVQIRDLILQGKVRAGEQLPSERQLAERFGLNRIHVREALQRLEFYGLVKTRRNSGTVVTGAGIRAIESIFSNVLALDGAELASLLETRWTLEVRLARFAAERADDADIDELRAAHEDFRREVEAGRDGLPQDLAFHLRLHDAARSPVMRSLTGLLIPDVMTLAVKDRTCDAGRAAQSLEEHRAILEAVAARDPARAAQAMEHHFAQGAPVHVARRKARG